MRRLAHPVFSAVQNFRFQFVGLSKKLVIASQWATSRAKSRRFAAVALETRLWAQWRGNPVDFPRYFVTIRDCHNQSADWFRNDGLGERILRLRSGGHGGRLWYSALQKDTGECRDRRPRRSLNMPLRGGTVREASPYMGNTDPSTRCRWLRMTPGPQAALASPGEKLSASEVRAAD